MAGRVPVLRDARAAGGLVSQMVSRFQVSLNRVARLPPFSMMTRERSRHSGLLGTIPKSRQMSAMTAPTAAAAHLGRDVLGRGQTGETRVGGAGDAVHGRGGARLATGWGARDGGRCGLLAGEAAGQSGLERGGAQQAAGDAREDFPDVEGAKVSRDIGGVGGGGALLQ